MNNRYSIFCSKTHKQERLKLANDSRQDAGEEPERNLTIMEDAVFDKFVAECEEEVKTGKESTPKAKNVKLTNKVITTVLKKLGSKLQKLATGLDWNEDGTFNSVMNLMVTKMNLGQLLNEEKIDETTCSTIFDNNWEWEDDAGEMLKAKILEIKDHRGVTFKDSEITETTGTAIEETTQKTVRELVFEEMANFYNKKVKI